MGGWAIIMPYKQLIQSKIIRLSFEAQANKRTINAMWKNQRTMGKEDVDTKESRWSCVVWYRQQRQKRKGKTVCKVNLYISGQ